MSKIGATSYQKALQKVKQTDPDFYDFLENQDANLLNFEISDDEAAPLNEKDTLIVGSENEEDEDTEEPDTDNEKIMVDEATESERLSGKKKKYGITLDEAMADVLESDEELDTVDEGSKEELTDKMLKAWERQLLTGRYNLESIKRITLAFKAILAKSGCKVAGSSYVIYKPSVYDRALQLCISKLPKVLPTALRYKSRDKGQRRRCSLGFKTKAIKMVVKDHVSDLIQFLPEVPNKSVLSTMLLHVSNMIEFLAAFPRKTRLLLKNLIKIWSTEADEYKLKAFDCILKVVVKLKDDLFVFAFKRMYLSYSKCATLRCSDVGSTGDIDCMQRCFVDLCKLDTVAVYQDAFVYIRELAVQLRTSILSKKKEALKTVYCRPYTNLLYLWSVGLNELKDDQNLTQLIYPLIQVIWGCSKHVTSSKYLPFHLHCLKCLLLLSRDCNLFSPVFVIAIQVLNGLSTKRRRSKKEGKNAAGVKCLGARDLDKIVKLSASQLNERSFEAAVVDKLADLLVVCLERFSCHPAFGELTFLLDLRLRKFCKDSRSTCNKHSSLDDQRYERLRLIAKRVAEHTSWMEVQKAKFSMDLSDPENLAVFQRNVSKDAANRMLSFCRSVGRLNQRQRKVRLAGEPLDDKLRHSGKRFADSQPIAPKRKLSFSDRKKSNKLK